MSAIPSRFQSVPISVILFVGLPGFVAGMITREQLHSTWPIFPRLIAIVGVGIATSLVGFLLLKIVSRRKKTV